MILLPKDIDWKAFGTYIEKRYSWFEISINDFFPNENPIENDFSRMDYILANISVVEDMISIETQIGDPFMEGLKKNIVSLNIEIRKKYDCYFLIEEIDHF